MLVVQFNKIQRKIIWLIFFFSFRLWIICNIIDNINLYIQIERSQSVQRQNWQNDFQFLSQRANWTLELCDVYSCCSLHLSHICQSYLYIISLWKCNCHMKMVSRNRYATLRTSEVNECEFTIDDAVWNSIENVKSSM